MAQDRRPNANDLLAMLAMWGGLGVFGLGLGLLLLWWAGNGQDMDIRHWAIYAIFAGAFIEIAVITRAGLVRAERRFPKRVR